jgi:[protein-PII] uridylyltransferase
MASGDPKVFDAARFDTALAALPDRNPSAALPLFRQALVDGRADLEQAWRDRTPVDRLITRHAALVDALLTRIWALHAPLLPPKLEVALIAVGGYGRGELHPHSDIDLLLLLKGEKHDQLKPFAEAFLQFLWDLGLEVGHSVRSLRDCVAESKKDITVATNLMEARPLAGDAALFEAMQTRTGPAKLWPSGKFFAAKLAEQRARHRRFDDTAYNLEPNLKEGPGGLRDIQMIAWVTQRHFGTRRLWDLVEHSFLTGKEHRALERGRRLLAELRFGLHVLAGRREDRLLFDHQRALAARLGYRDRGAARGVELFMKRYYRTVKELALLNEILLQHFDEALLIRGHARVRPLNRRFQTRGAYLETVRANVFERFPFALLELFLVMQQHPKLKGVRAATIRQVRENLHRINGQFRNDLACRSLFMEILRQPRGITHELRRMNAYGVLGAYLPVFGRIVGQMQHDLFHVYTVDQHTLFVLRNLRRFTVPAFRNEFPLASELIQRVVKPERLYLVALFHDIAKGRGGDHSELGEHEATAFCRHHGLSDYDTHFIAWLVRHHLLMSHVAQRQDINDPGVVLQFARQVGDIERLDHLYLLTVADMRGTSPSVWNVWKDRLLTQLHAETTRALRRGFAEPLDLAARVADLKTGALAPLETAGTSRAQAEEHWARLETDYFLRHDSGAIAWHTAQIVGTPASALPLTATRYHPGSGGTEVLVYTPDRDDLFAVITGGFDRLNLTIMDARVHTTRFGFALDTFVVLDHAMQPITDPRALAELASAMRAQLLDPQPGRDFQRMVLPRALKHFPIATRVSFSPSVGGQQTIMEVRAQDRPGLLYQVALALQHCRARLLTAKVATYGERAEDYFFLTGRDGLPLTSAESQACLRREILARLGASATAPATAIDF